MIGLQWGDEAKGKIVDLLTERHEIVVRYQGGANAGHTVVTGGQKYKLSLIPSGILHPGVISVITGGVVLYPKKVLEEIEELRTRGVAIDGNLRISDRAHVIFPWHFEEERVFQVIAASGESIGTTMRGIGPCYRDKVGRSHAIRLGDLYRESFAQRLQQIVQEKNRLLSAGATNADCEFTPLDADVILAEYRSYAEKLRPFVCETTTFLHDALEEGRRLLFEGAQGALLDLDHGTFPYVTSSNSSGVGISPGSGVPGKYMNHVIGVAKAYSTRVGGGPFVTELDDEVGQHIRDRGDEYGTVTRRPRRCGWFDAVAVRYTARLSGVDALAVALLDVLGDMDELKICVAYDINGERTTTFPSHDEDLAAAKPIYETLPGWKREITDVRNASDLPDMALRYLERIGELVDRPVDIVSVGPDRDQTIFLNASATENAAV